MRSHQTGNRTLPMSSATCDQRAHISLFVVWADPEFISVCSIAFIEFCKDNDGKVTREGPRREKGELPAQDARE